MLTMMVSPILVRFEGIGGKELILKMKIIKFILEDFRRMAMNILIQIATI